MPLPPELTERRDGRRSRLGDLVARLSSDSDNEVVNTARAIGRALKAHGADFHDLVGHIEEPPLNARQIELIRNEIDETAKKLAEGMRAEAPRPNFNDFRSTDGSDDRDDWRQLAIHIDENKGRLSPRDYNDWAREFIDDMATRARHDPYYEVHPRQYVQLRKFFVRLGGKIT
jgi:hypothetical protein